LLRVLSDLEVPVSNQRYVLLAFVLFAIAFGMAVQAASVSAFAQLAVPDARLLGLVNTSTAVSLLAGLLSFVALIRTPVALNFVSEVVGELQQVTWPSRDETVRGSTTVVLTTIFTASLLAVYDFIWKNLADLVLFTEG
jgi:preprotein translocase SecE subunit